MTGAVLSDAAIDLLEAYLDSEQAPEESMDFLQAHGFLTALAISPVPMDAAQWLPELLATATPTQGEDADIPGLLQALRDSIEATLSDGERLTLPCELSLGKDPDDSDLRAWCAAFMEGHFMDEDAWFAQDGEAVSELLLPILAISGLFDDPELQALLRNPRQAQALCRDIPEVLTDLYLGFRLAAGSRDDDGDA